MVTSPTTATAPLLKPSSRPVSVRGGLIVALCLALGAAVLPSAQAESLNDSRNQVRKQISQARKEIASEKNAVADATAELASSQDRLAQARSELAAIKKDLKAAKKASNKATASYRAARLAAQLAAELVQESQAAVDAQEEFIAEAIRVAYQQHNPLIGLSLILDSVDQGDLARRLQWSTLIFDNSTAELAHLNELLAKLEQAKVKRDQAQDDAEAKREAAQKHLRDVERLNRSAQAQAAKISALVARNLALKVTAEGELEQSQAEYQKLQAKEAKLTAKIKAAERKYALVNANGFIRPVNAPAGSPFGMRFHPILNYARMHWGTDFGAPCGAPIRAMADGRVISAGWTTVGFGNYTVISYGKYQGKYISSGYAHQSKVLVKAGQKVRQGQVVGYVGTTGLSTGCHLHLQIYRDGERVNPMNYL